MYIIERRRDDWIAYEEGKPKVWESGKTAMEAVYKLMVTLGLVTAVEREIDLT